MASPKQYFLKLEITVFIIFCIFVIALTTNYSFLILYKFFLKDLFIINENFLDHLIWLAMYIFWPHFMMYFHNIWGFIFNILFYSLLFFLVIWGFLNYREKRKYLFIHTLLLIFSVLHLIAFIILYDGFVNLAGV